MIAKIYAIIGSIWAMMLIGYFFQNEFKMNFLPVFATALGIFIVGISVWYIAKKRNKETEESY